MLFKQVNVIHFSLLVCLFSSLTGCSNNQAAQNLFAADPKLTENSAATSNLPSETAPNPTPIQLPDNFPQQIPLYPDATILDRELAAAGKGEKTLWESSDPSNLIANYYQRELLANDWQIIESFSPDADNTLIASRDGTEVKVSIVSTSPKTQFAIEYQGTGNSLQSETETSNSNLTASGPQNFSDLEQVTPQLRQYIEDLAALGVLTRLKSDDSAKTNLFKPNQTITRREYALWLVAANNKLHLNQAGKQIRPASQTSQPAFQDIKPNDPDFAIIQGLAEAGVIPSPLTGNSSALLFRPDAPLTRANLLEWKVPLDLRQALPSASMETIKETWGFQDTTKINNPKVWRSLYADFQNGEQANVRRVFGYTTLFQPQKPVTRAEAAAALWYFGYQGEGMSAEEALQLSNSSAS